MPFDFAVWKEAVLKEVECANNRLDLLVASGLIEEDSLEEAFEKVLIQLEAEIAENQRRAADGEQHG